MCSFARSEAVTPSNTEIVNFSAIYVGGAGDVTIEVMSASDTVEDVTFTALPAGGYVLAQGSKIKATGTTATNLVRLW